MASDADAYERGVKIAQTSLTPNFREGVQANPWFQLGYQMGVKHGPRAAGMMSQAKSEFPTVAARLKASRPGQPEQFAKQVISTRGNKRAEISGPDGGGQWRAYVIQKVPTGLPSEPYHEDLLGDMKFFDTEEKARRAAIKMLASRPGAKDTMASHKESFQKEYILWALPKGETDRLHERPIAEGITTPQQMDDAKRKAASQGWHGFRVQILDMNKPFRWMSRPGAKDTMAVEDRFYFGKGRKERFADDAKQIADTILKQLGGGRFIAMTGAKNLAFMSNPPGLHMSIGRGAKDGIKYLRVNYDRGSDTYTMIFANKSGGTVKSVSNVYADALRRTFTSTTGFDTSL